MFFEGTHPKTGDVFAVFLNADESGVTVRRCCAFTDSKLGEAVYVPGPAAQWGAGAPEGEKPMPSVFFGPKGASFTVASSGQTAYLKLGAS